MCNRQIVFRHFRRYSLFLSRHIYLDRFSFFFFYNAFLDVFFPISLKPLTSSRVVRTPVDEALTALETITAVPVLLIRPRDPGRGWGRRKIDMYDTWPTGLLVEYPPATIITTTTSATATTTIIDRTENRSGKFAIVFGRRAEYFRPGNGRRCRRVPDRRNHGEVARGGLSPMYVLPLSLTVGIYFSALISGLVRTLIFIVL